MIYIIMYIYIYIGYKYLYIYIYIHIFVTFKKTFPSFFSGPAQKIAPAPGRRPNSSTLPSVTRGLTLRTATGLPEVGWHIRFVQKSSISETV